jgi:hypothetical protein
MKLMLNINPEIVCNIIVKAREFFAKEEVAIPEEPEEAEDFSDDWYFKVLASFKDDLTFQELKSNIKDLEPDQQAALVALLWIGRGDFDNWDSAFSEAQRNWNSQTAEYLLTKPLLPDYLEDGLAYFDYHCD